MCLPQDLQRFGENFHGRGTLKGWKRIPELVRGNTRLMLAISLSFVGPVVAMLRVEEPMFQVFGPPGLGKSSMGEAVAATWGKGTQSWNNTSNYTELLASAFNETFLVLDETRAADQSRAGRTPAIFQLVMRLAGGQVRGRLTDVAAPLRFETPILSLSNESLDEIAPRWRVEIDDAHRDRLIDVPLEPAGMFENLHGFENRAALSAEPPRRRRAPRRGGARVPAPVRRRHPNGSRRHREVVAG